MVSPSTHQAGGCKINRTEVRPMRACKYVSSRADWCEAASRASSGCHLGTCASHPPITSSALLRLSYCRHACERAAREQRLWQPGSANLTAPPSRGCLRAAGAFTQIPSIPSAVHACQVLGPYMAVMRFAVHRLRSTTHWCRQHLKPHDHTDWRVVQCAMPRRP